MKADVIEKRLSDGSSVFDVMITKADQAKKIFIEMESEEAAHNMAGLVNTYRVLDIYQD